MSPQDREEILSALAQALVDLDAARLARALRQLEEHELLRLLDVIVAACEPGRAAPYLG